MIRLTQLIPALNDLAAVFTVPKSGDIVQRAERRNLLKRLPREINNTVLISSSPSGVSLHATNTVDWMQRSLTSADLPAFQAVVNLELLKRLTRVMARTGVTAIDLEATADGLALTPARSHYCPAHFRYELRAVASSEIFPIFQKIPENPLALLGIPSKMVISNNHGLPAMTPITITNRYYADLDAAVAAGAIAVKGKNPSKADLYAAIEAHNASLTPAIADEPTADELLALDAAEDALKAAQPKTRKRKSSVPSKLDLLVQAMEQGITDIDALALASGMKPQGVKGWVGVIRNQGIDNWKQSNRKKAS